MTDNFGFAPTEKMLTPTTLAQMLEISDRHLTDVRREDQTFPSPVLLGTLPRWSPAAIRRWMDGGTDATSGTGSGQLHLQPVATETTAPRKRKGASRV